MASRLPVLRDFSIWRRRIFKGSLVLIGSAGAVEFFRSVDSVRDIPQIGLIRFGRAAVAVSHIVFDYKYSLWSVPYPSFEYSKVIHEVHSRSAQRLLQLACANGGVFIKVGQHCASLEYLLPKEYTGTLSVLLSKAPASTFEDVKAVLEEELHCKLEDEFEEFSAEPCGAASLAQVHIARHKATGVKLAVKVQHRRVKKNAITDTNTMDFLVHMTDRLFPGFQLNWLVEEVKRNLPCELDFRLEADNADRLREMVKHLPFLKVPMIYRNLSTDRVLTMEFCEGEHIDNKEYMIANEIDRHDSLGETFRELYSCFWLAVLKPDQDEIKRVARAMGVGELYGIFACMVTRRSWASVLQGVQKSQLSDSERLELRAYAFSLIPQISQVLQRMPREMLLIMKTNDLLRGIEHSLGCAGRADGLIEMSKSVVRSWHTIAIGKAASWRERLRLRISLMYGLARLFLYDYALRVNSKLPLTVQFRV